MTSQSTTLRLPQGNYVRLQGDNDDIHRRPGRKLRLFVYRETTLVSAGKLYVKSDILDALWGYARMQCQCTIAAIDIRADRETLPFPEGVAARIVCEDDKRGFDDTFCRQC